MILNKLTIRTKLSLGIGILIIILSGLAFYLLVSINTYEEYVRNIEAKNEYNSIVEATQLEDLRKVNFLRRYVSSRNPVFVDQINILSETIFENLNKIKLLGENSLILNALDDLTNDIEKRQVLIDKLILDLDNAASNEYLFEKLLEIDELSADIQVYLDHISEISSVELLQQTEELDENFYLNRLTSLVLIIIVSLFLIVVSYVLINSISIPLTRMNVAAKRISEGDFDFEMEVKSSDEIGVLMRTFNEMRSKLNEYYQDMEMKVASRTEKLKKTVEELNGTKESLLGTLKVLEDKQKDIEKQKVRSDAILFNLGEGLVFLDNTGVVEFGNKAVTDLLGYNSTDYVGQVWYELVKPSHDNGEEIPKNELSFNILKKDISREKVSINLNEGHNYKGKNGEYLPVSVVASKVFHNDEVIGMILVFRDVRKEREVDKAKTEFVSLASHQLRTPLTSISWNTEMLINGEAGEVKEEQKVYLEEIYYGSKRLINLVNSLLNTSRLDMGNFIIEPEEVDVIKFTNDIIHELEPNLKDRGMNLEFIYDEIGKLKIDRKLYHIVIENLLTNAIKYTDKNGDITLYIQTQSDGDILIKVEDNGYGIPDDQKDQIFSKLFRADNVKSKDTDGTGLGLYLVKAIIEYVGGKIWFDSHEEVGTTFYVVLPKGGMKAKRGEKSLSTK